MPDKVNHSDPREAVHVATQETRWSILKAMTDGAESLSEIGDAVGIDDQLVYHHMKELIPAGLVEQEKVTPNKGNAYTRYTLKERAWNVHLSKGDVSAYERVGR